MCLQIIIMIINKLINYLLHKQRWFEQILNINLNIPRKILQCSYLIIFIISKMRTYHTNEKILNLYYIRYIYYLLIIFLIILRYIYIFIVLCIIQYQYSLYKYDITHWVYLDKATTLNNCALFVSFIFTINFQHFSINNFQHKFIDKVDR